MQGRLRKSGQEDRWSFCLRSTLSPSADDEARLKEAHDFSRAGLRCPHLPQFLDPPEVGRWDRPGAVFMGSRVACWTDGNTSSCQNNFASVECGECFDMTAILNDVLMFICITVFYVGIIIAAANLLAG
jgi:hypothetical protein